MSKVPVPRAKVSHAPMKQGVVPVAPGPLGGAGGQSLAKLAQQWVKSGKLKVTMHPAGSGAMMFEWRGLPPAEWRALSNAQMDKVQRLATRIAKAIKP